MVLVDTSVWIDHLRQGEARLSKLLDEGEVVIHPFVIGELACGNLKNRNEILLGSLRQHTRSVPIRIPDCFRKLQTAIHAN